VFKVAKVGAVFELEGVFGHDVLLYL